MDRRGGCEHSGVALQNRTTRRLPSSWRQLDGRCEGCARWNCTVRVRRACMVEGMSTREAARVFGLHRDTVRKMLEYSAPEG